MKMYISNSNKLSISTSNLPTELDIKVCQAFTNFIFTNQMLQGHRDEYKLLTFDPKDQKTAITLTFTQEQANLFVIRDVFLSDYVDGELFETGLSAGYHLGHNPKWMSPIEVVKRFESADAFVANVLQRFNDYAQTNQSLGDYIYTEGDEKLSDLYDRHYKDEHGHG